MCSISGQTRSAEWVLLSKLWENLIFPRPNKWSWGGWKFLNQLTKELIFFMSFESFKTFMTLIDFKTIETFKNWRPSWSFTCSWPLWPSIPLRPPSPSWLSGLCDLYDPLSFVTLQIFMPCLKGLASQIAKLKPLSLFMSLLVLLLKKAFDNVKIEKWKVKVVLA